MINTKFYKLFDDPLIYVISSGLLFKSGILAALQSDIRREFTIIVQPSWYVIPQSTYLLSIINEVKKLFPKIRFIFICPTIAETLHLRKLGCLAFNIHKNAFIDSTIFTPENVEKMYDAVHVANIMPFKRHYLAWNVPNIAVVTYDYTGQQKEFLELSGYKHIAFSNFTITDGSIRLDDFMESKEKSMSKMSLSPYEVKKVICQSHCGLILSEVEGANLASTEYLLCGIPVVSTKSVGGRSELFDERHVKIVEPIAEQVENAVSFFRKNEINKDEIRNSVMLKIRSHRKNFIELLSKLTGSNLILTADQDYWLPNFTNKLMTRVSIDEADNFGIQILSLRS